MGPVVCTVMEHKEMEDTNKLKDEVESAVSRAENLGALEAIRIYELGKNGRITLLMKGLGQLGPAERRLVGKNLNELKNTIIKSVNPMSLERI